MSGARTLRDAFNRVSKDAIGIAHVVGSLAAIRWLFSVIATAPDIIATRNLQSADRAMGTGPFPVRFGFLKRFYVSGPGAFSGIREMFVRDVYLRGGLLTIKDHDVVLDLGANIGNFTNLALAHGAHVRVIAVEPNLVLQERMAHSIGLNDGFASRVTHIRAVLGVATGLDSASHNPEFAEVPLMHEDQIIRDANLTQIDFLKCDIEGGEFGLMHPTSALLKMTQTIAVEIHAFAGDVEQFISMLEIQGFSILHIQRDADGTATVLGKRR